MVSSPFGSEFVFPPYNGAVYVNVHVLVKVHQGGRRVEGCLRRRVVERVESAVGGVGGGLGLGGGGSWSVELLYREMDRRV